MATLEICVTPVLEKANVEELKTLYVITKKGKKFLQAKTESERKAIIEETLKEDFKTLFPWKVDLINGILKNMDEAITEGVGFFDLFRDMDLYPRQLLESIDMLTKALEKKAKDVKDENWKKELQELRREAEIKYDCWWKYYSEYKNKYHQIYFCSLSEEFEETITTLLFDAYIKTLPRDERLKLEKKIEEAIRNYADKIDLDISNVQVGYLLAHGGLIVLRSVLGFQFHIILSIVVNTIWKFSGALITGSGLSFATNALIQRIAAVALGPIGWVITGLLTLPLITKTINPREWDKYLPAVVYIYLFRQKPNLEQYKNMPE